MHAFDGGIRWESGPNELLRTIILARQNGVGDATALQICEQIYDPTTTGYVRADRREGVSVGPYRGAVLEVRSQGYVVAVGLDDSAPNGVDAYILVLDSKPSLREGDLALFDRVLESIRAAGG